MWNITYLECMNEGFVDDSIEVRHSDYNLVNCVLVRCTDIFPFDRIVQTPIHGKAITFDDSFIIGQAIVDVLRRKFSGTNLRDECRKYEICFETLRSTIHFTVNGLVSSHEGGNFEDRPYVIVEPLKYHINDKSLCSLIAEDTYFNDDMFLSEEAVLLIHEDKFNEIKNDEKYINDLSNFKLYVWRGNNQRQALKQVFNGLGYDYFSISSGYSNGIKNGSAAEKIGLCLENLRNQFNISGVTHNYSSVFAEDSMNLENNLKNIQKAHLYYLIQNSNVSSEVISFIEKFDRRGFFELDTQEFWDEYYYNENNVRDVMIRLVKEIGLERIEQLTKEFNSKYIESLNFGNSMSK